MFLKKQCEKRRGRENRGVGGWDEKMRVVDERREVGRRGVKRDEQKRG